jgi:gliding motility-associated-like protein
MFKLCIAVQWVPFNVYQTKINNMIKTFTLKTVHCFLFVFFLSFLSVVNAQAATPPVISSFSPASGPVGTIVTITGTGFSTTASSNIVFFGATMATVSSATATSLTVSVPAGASYQTISILNGTTQLAGYSSSPFIVTFPGHNSIAANDFAAQVNFTTAATPVNIATADLDGDGKPDLVVVNNGANTISLLRNTSTNGSITSSSFATKVDLTTGSIPYYVAIADLDGDGKPEIVVANNVGNSVSVFYNKSTKGSITTGSFSGKVDFAVGTAPRSVAIGDIDGDGKADLIVSNTTSNNVSILMNTTTTGSITASSFAAAVNFATGSGPRGIAVGDLDGDGKPDLAIADFGASTVSVLRNTATAGVINSSSFAATVDITCGLHPYVVAIGDIDGDGKPDMAVANQGANTVSVIRNTSTSGSITTASFATAVNFTTPSTPTGVAIGDLDGDGKPDIAITNQGNSSVSVFRNTATSGAISSSSLATRVDYAVGTTPYNSVIEDIDGDGMPDLVTVNNGLNNISVLHSTPTPVTQATNVTFSSTTSTATTISWTNGSGTSRAVFILAGTAGNPSPVNYTTYSASTVYASGMQIGTSGWYCIYNGTAATVNITNLTAGTNYKVMTIEYNGAAGNELYQTATATGNPANLYNPVISTTGTLAAVATTYGTASPSQTFSVSGSEMTAGILVTPPTGFEVSTDNSTFTNTVTIGASGTISSTPVYIRLMASSVPKSYSGNVVLSSSGATSVNVATTSSTISKAVLTITANNQTNVYGAALPTLTVSYSGFVNGDDFTALTTQPTLSTTVTTTSSTVGSPYSITVSGAAAANYTINYVAGSLTITPAALTITATSASKTYGSANPALAVTYSGFVGTDNVASLTTQPAILTTAVTGSSVNTYPITASGATANNYTINYVAGILSVTPAILTITADSQTKTYGAAVPTLTASYAGFVNGDDYTVLTTNTILGTTATATSIVEGSPYPITASGAASANYTINYVPGTLTVTPAALTIAASSTSKTYGSVNPALAVTYSGFVGTDNAASLDTPPTILTTAVTGSPANTYPITASGAASNNYIISYVPGTLTVAPAMLTIAATNTSKTYGSVNPTFAVTYSGFVGTDNAASLTTAPTILTTAVNNSPVNTYPITASDAVSANYTINYVDGTLTITPATLTITADDVSKFPGSALTGGAGSSAFIATGLANGETAGTVTIAYGSGAAVSDPQGIYVGQVTPSLLTGGNFAASNYNINYVKGNIIVGTSSISESGTLMALTSTYGTASANTSFNVSGNNLSNNITVTAPLGFEVSTVPGSGFNNSITLVQTAGTVNSTPIFLRLSAGAGAGSYSGSVTLTSAGAETVNVATISSTVNAAALSITATAATKTYGVANPALTVTYNGFVGTDNAASLTSQPIISTTAVTSSPVNTYPITASGATSPNYTISYIAGTLTVTPAELTVTAANASKIYGAANPSFSVTYNGFVGADNAANLTIQPTISTTGITNSPVNTYPITVNGAASNNYTISYVEGTLTVTPAVLTITATSTSKIYGSANPTLGVTYTGFVGTDNALSLTTQPIVSTTALTSSPVNTYPVTASGAASANYTISYVAGTLAITPAPLTITANNQIKSFGIANPALTLTYTGFVNGDSAASLVSAPAVSTTAITNSPVGNYPIMVTGASSPNYTISYVQGILTISAPANANLANLTISNGTLAPLFAQGTTAYTIAVANTITSASITPTAVDPTAAINVNGTGVASGATSVGIPLAVGANVITTIVTAQDGITKITYTVTVTRAPSNNAVLANLAVSSGTLVPNPGTAIYNYTDLVDNTISQITVTSTLSDATATVLVNGAQVSNAAASSPINLLVGDNTINIVTTAQDGVTKLTYTIIVHRATAPDLVKANNILSPNGDGKNDTWMIKDILSYPNNKVTVFDVAGRIVYTKKTYTNDWDGTLRGSPLAEGTYYYVIDLGVGDSIIKGFVTILRQR